MDRIKDSLPSGAMTIAVSCLMMVLVLLGTILVRSSNQTLEVALQRSFYEKRSRVLASLLCYTSGIIDAYRESLLLLPIGTHIVHELNAWPIGSKCASIGTVIIIIKKENFVVTTRLQDGDIFDEKTTLYARD